MRVAGESDTVSMVRTKGMNQEWVKHGNVTRHPGDLTDLRRINVGQFSVQLVIG